MKTHEITIQTTTGPMTVEVTGKEFSNLHSKLTTYYNDHFREIEDEEEDQDPYGVIADEINQDHANDNQI
jgi:hypothetical protein